LQFAFRCAKILYIKTKGGKNNEVEKFSVQTRYSVAFGSVLFRGGVLRGFYE